MKKFINRYLPLILPIISILLYFVINRLFVLTPIDDFESNLIEFSGTLAGFLLTSLTIIIALPPNKFTEILKESKVLRRVQMTILAGIILSFSSMIFGLYGAKIIMTYLFIASLSETILSAVYVLRIGKFSNMSK